MFESRLLRQLLYCHAAVVRLSILSYLGLWLVCAGEGAHDSRVKVTGKVDFGESFLSSIHEQQGNSDTDLFAELPIRVANHSSHKLTVHRLVLSCSCFRIPKLLPTVRAFDRAQIDVKVSVCGPQGVNVYKGVLLGEFSDGSKLVKTFSVEVVRPVLFTKKASFIAEREVPIAVSTPAFPGGPLPKLRVLGGDHIKFTLQRSGSQVSLNARATIPRTAGVPHRFELVTPLMVGCDSIYNGMAFTK